MQRMIKITVYVLEFNKKKGFYLFCAFFPELHFYLNTRSFYYGGTNSINDVQVCTKLLQCISAYLWKMLKVTCLL